MTIEITSDSLVERSTSPVFTPVTRPEFTLDVPWAECISDNGKYAHARSKALSVEYAYAKQCIAYRAIRGMREQRVPKFLGPVLLIATVIEPDRARRRDLSNWCKLLHDAMEGIVYQNDSQIDVLRYDRALPDPKNPHIHIYITDIK